MSSEWGRIDDDGTVYLRTADGERVIGSWHAGSVEDGLAFYVRRYDDLQAEVALLEKRATSGLGNPSAVGEAARKLREVVPSAAAMGDLDGLASRLDAVLRTVEERKLAKRAEKAAAAQAATNRMQEIVDEGETLAASESWKATGERFRELAKELAVISGVDHKTREVQRRRLAKYERKFRQRRGTHFAEVEASRAVVAEHKQKLAVEAEKLAESTDWTTTARRYRDLMAEWKAAGRASREKDEELWTRFKTAQDTFFAHRSEAFAARDAEQKSNLDAKRALIAEAETIDASADRDGARKRLRSIHDRWEKIGHVPRESKNEVEDQLAAVEAKIREASAAGRTVEVAESPLVIRLRESVGKLEARLARAEAAGDTGLAEQTRESLVTQREWLAQAESAS